MRLIAGFVAGLAALFACVTIAVTAQRIEEAGYLQIGGVEQWVTIRGDGAGNPILLLLHGEPGDVQSPFVSVYASYDAVYLSADTAALQIKN
jgi:hypothetical protein